MGVSVFNRAAKVLGRKLKDGCWGMRDASYVYYDDRSISNSFLWEFFFGLAVYFIHVVCGGNEIAIV